MHSLSKASQCLQPFLEQKLRKEVSIRIMDAFVALRKYISSNLIEQKYINDLVLEDHVKIKTLEDSFKKIEEKRKVSKIIQIDNQGMQQ